MEKITFILLEISPGMFIILIKLKERDWNNGIFFPTQAVNSSVLAATVFKMSYSED